jgi:hypothetical protein
MILLLSVFITNQRQVNRYSRIDIFKYMLESYKKIPFTEVYLFIKLDNEFLLPGQYFHENDLTDYLYNNFSHLRKDKIHIVLDRYTSQDKWKPFIINLMEKHGPNEPVWLAQNDDHPFIDYNTDVLMEGIELLNNDTNKYKSISYSHWPEAIKSIGKLKHTKINNYIRCHVTCLDGIQIFNLQYLYYFFVEYTWKNDHLLLDRLFVNEILPTIGGFSAIFNNHFSQVIYIPLRELCRHFDGYDHVGMDRDAFPELELPHNTFDYSKDTLIKKMTTKHNSYWTENNTFTHPQEWIDTMISLHTIDKYVL